MSKDPQASYYDHGIETIEIIRAKLTPEQFKGYCLGNVIKYACRYNFKHINGIGKQRDMDKIINYATFMEEEKCTK